MTTQKKVNGYLLIDTNMYHRLFVEEDFEKKVLPVLKKNISNGHILLLPQQIIDEINRNRYTEWSKDKNAPLVKSLETTRSLVEKEESRDLPHAQKFIKQITSKIEALKKENVKFHKKITSSKGAELIKVLTDLSVVCPDSLKILELVQLRKIKGNPPFDKNGGQEKSCDRYIWEAVLSFFSENEIKKPKLFLFTKNHNDWCVDASGSTKTLNPFLVEEFKQKTGGSIVWSDDLKNLPDISEKEKQGVQKVESDIDDRDMLGKIQLRLADKLRASNSWGTTDKLINIVAPYIKKFDAETISGVLKASIENKDYSFGPYNQVLDASKAETFIVQLYNRSREIDFPIGEWRSFYLLLDRDEQQRFYGLRKALEKRGVEFSHEELKFIHADDIPF